jgi:multidrug efflux pump subunit AcrB
MSEKKGLTKILITNWRFTLFFSLIALILGIYSYYIVPKQESPDVSAPYAIIKTIYPGASPEDVEKLVTRVIEEKVQEVPGYKTTHSFSKNSISIVALELNNDVDTDKSWNELRRILEDVQDEIPSECQKINVDTKLSETAGIIISFSGEGYSCEQLETFADEFKTELSKTQGISRFTVSGEQNKIARVEVHVAELNKYSLSLDDLVNLLKAQNLQIPSGALTDGNVKITVSTPGIFTSLTDIENTVIDVSRTTGAVVRLKDVAEVKWDLEESNNLVRHNGQEAILLNGFFSENKNIVLIGQEVRTRLEQLKSQMPSGLNIEDVVFQPTDVRNSVSHFFKNLLEGIGLVLIVVFLGMGYRNALVASTAVPLSIAVAFIIMVLTGIKLHEISIAALIIALGILVDDAIVVIDAIQVNIDQGYEKMEACIKGMKQSMIPVFSATLTIAAAFSPMLFVPGPAGEFLKSLPVMVIFSVGASFLVAITVTPVLAYLFFDKLKERTEKPTFFRRFYNVFLNTGMKHKKMTILISLLLIFLSVFAGLGIQIEFFPKADKNMFYINLYSESAADIEATEKLAEQAEHILAEKKEILSYTTSVGDGLPKFYITLPKATPAQNFAQIMLQVDLKQGNYKNNEQLALFLQEQFDQKLTGGEADVLLLEKALPGAPLEIRINGDDSAAVYKAVKVIRQELEEIPGTIKVEDDNQAKEYEFMVDVDSDKATGLGITKYDVQRQINIALKGAEASLFRKAGNEYSIVVDSDIQTKEDLENLAIRSSIAGNKVLLKQIAQIHLQSTVPTIKKYDGIWAVTVTSKVKPGYSAVTIENTLKQKIAESDFDFSGITLFYEGEAKDIKDNFGSLGMLALFTLVLIYIILMLQFKSFLQPWIILTTIPLSIIGVVAGLLLFRQPLSFTALIGVVSLMGLVIRNAILLIEYINEARREGMLIAEACNYAVERRYRPIILSAVTTVIGLVPLALSGSDLFMPLSIALMSGLLVSTLFTLVVVPVVYSTLVHEEKNDISGNSNNSTKSALLEC